MPTERSLLVIAREQTNLGETFTSAWWGSWRTQEDKHGMTQGAFPLSFHPKSVPSLLQLFYGGKIMASYIFLLASFVFQSFYFLLFNVMANSTCKIWLQIWTQTLRVLIKELTMNVCSVLCFILVINFMQGCFVLTKNQNETKLPHNT